MKPELQKLFEGVNGLSPEFLGQVSNLLESKVAEARTQAILQTEEAGNAERLKLVEAHQLEIAELKESNIQAMAVQVDAFLNNVVEEWANKNAPGIDAMIKTEAAEKFLLGMAGVLKEAGVEFATDPEGRIEELTNRLAESEAKRQASDTELLQIREGHAVKEREDVINRVCEGLVDTKKSTVVGLLEGIEFTDKESFESRVRIFRNLVEGNKPDPEEGKDKPKPGDGKPEEGKDKPPVKEGEGDGDDGAEGDDDENADKELQESIRRQREDYLRRYGKVNG